jgi:hypothetical protein
VPLLKTELGKEYVFGQDIRTGIDEFCLAHVKFEVLVRHQTENGKAELARFGQRDHKRERSGSHQCRQHE